MPEAASESISQDARLSPSAEITSNCIREYWRIGDGGLGSKYCEVVGVAAVQIRP